MSRFTAHLGLTLAEDAAGRPETRDGRCTWLLSEPLTYEVGAEGSGLTITVPAGFRTDLASIPAFARGLLPADGPWAKAAVVHDWLYRNRGVITWAGGKVYTRKEADAVLAEAMVVLGVPAWKRTIIHAAVRLGGGRGWGS